MKKAIFTLAVLAMAFGNVGMAQKTTKLKNPELKTVMEHYGRRVRDDLMPEKASWSTVDGAMYRVTYIYDENEYYLNEELYEMKEGGGEWATYGSVTYGYDFSGNVIEACELSWDGNEWQYEALATYTYNGDEISEIIYQYWDDDDWVNDIKEVYNFMGDVTTILFWEWNGNTWSSSELYTYTRSGNTIELLKQYMQGGAWQNDEKAVYTLDFDENVVEVLEQDWNNAWVNDELTTYLYEGGVFTQKYIKDWTGSAWVDDYSFFYTYDAKGNAEHGECYVFAGYDWGVADGDIEMAYGYNSGSTSFYGCVVDMTYIDVTALKENAQAASFEVYPNPVEGELRIQTYSFGKAEIYSITGQKLMESVVDTFSVSALPMGVYLLKVYDLEGHGEMQRIVVK